MCILFILDARNAFNASNIQEVEHMNEPMASNSINRYGPTEHAQVWGQEYYALKGEWGFMLL